MIKRTGLQREHSFISLLRYFLQLECNLVTHTLIGRLIKDFLLRTDVSCLQVSVRILTPLASRESIYCIKVKLWVLTVKSPPQPLWLVNVYLFTWSICHQFKCASMAGHLWFRDLSNQSASDKISPSVISPLTLKPFWLTAWPITYNEAIQVSGNQGFPSVTCYWLLTTSMSCSEKCQ